MTLIPTILVLPPSAWLTPLGCHAQSCRLAWWTALPTGKLKIIETIYSQFCWIHTIFRFLSIHFLDWEDWKNLMKVLSYKSWKIVNIERIEQETLWMSIVIDIIQVIKVIENWENWSLWKLSRLKTSKTIMTIKTKKIIRVIRVISSQSSESLESSQSSTNSRGSFIPSYVFIKIWEQDKNIYKLSGSHIKSPQLKRFYGLPQKKDCNIS